jgi:hypothetical protein
VLREAVSTSSALIVDIDFSYWEILLGIQSELKADN